MRKAQKKSLKLKHNYVLCVFGKKRHLKGRKNGRVVVCERRRSDSSDPLLLHNLFFLLLFLGNIKALRWTLTCSDLISLWCCIDALESFLSPTGIVWWFRIFTQNHQWLSCRVVLIQAHHSHTRSTRKSLWEWPETVTTLCRFIHNRTEKNLKELRSVLFTRGFRSLALLSHFSRLEYFSEIGCVGLCVADGCFEMTPRNH